MHSVPRLPKATAAFLLATVVALTVLVVLGLYDGCLEEAHHKLGHDKGGGATPPAPACSDGKDNDGAGKTDYPADLGCTDTNNTDETDSTTPPPPPSSDPDTTGWTSLEKYNYFERIKGIDRFFALDTKGVSHEPYIGETNTPNSRTGPHSTDIPDWNALLEKMLTELEKRGATISGFSVDENQIWGGYTLNTYSSGPDGTSNPAIDTPNDQAPIWEKHLTKTGYNESKAGGELGAGIYAGSGHVMSLAGTAVSPTTGMDTFQYLKSRGYKNVRLEFRWELLQPALGGEYDPANLAELKRAVADARSAGLTVIIEPHNYAWYKVSDATYYKLGDGNLTGEHFADLWKRLSTEFKSDPQVVYDLMNEPGVQGPIPLNGYSNQAKAWEAYSQQAVDAIRANGDDKLIYVPTWQNSDIIAAFCHPTGPWINDPAKNHQYAFHTYYWVNGWQGSGNYSLDYPTEDAHAKAAGY